MVIPGPSESEEPGIYNRSAGTMVSGFATAWRPGMTEVTVMTGSQRR
jgi:hypothetical protein